MAGNLELPELLKHMALVIYAKGYVRGTKIEQLAESLNIARRQLAEWGYLTAGSAKGPLDKIQVTGKGQARTMKHRREKNGMLKTMQFDQLFAPILEAYETKRTQETPELPSGASADERDDQRKLIVVRAALSKAKAPPKQPNPRRLKRAKVAKAAKPKSARRR